MSSTQRATNAGLVFMHFCKRLRAYSFYIQYTVSNEAALLLKAEENGPTPWLDMHPPWKAWVTAELEQLKKSGRDDGEASLQRAPLARRRLYNFPTAGGLTFAWFYGMLLHAPRARKLILDELGRVIRNEESPAGQDPLVRIIVLESLALWDRRRKERAARCG